MTIQTKITVNSTDYRNIQQMSVVLSIAENNTSGNFSLSVPNWGGLNKSNFSVGNDIQIYATKDAAPTTKIFRGVIDDIQFTGQEQNERIVLSGRDYSAVLQDISITPITYSNSEVSTIVTNLMALYAPTITTTNVDVTTTTVSHITFNHVNLFDALKQLANLSGFYFYVDTDKDLHFENIGATSSGLTFDTSNVSKAEFKNTTEEMANQVWVYGDRTITGRIEKFTGDGAGSVYTLQSNPHNTEVTVNGSIQRGGVFEMSVGETGSFQYLVNFDQKKVIFISGTTYVYGNSIPPLNGSVVISYGASVPIAKLADDPVSIALYGTKSKVIIDKSITQPNTARDLAISYLENHKDPIVQGLVEVNGVLSLTPGSTVDVNLPNHGISSVTYSVIEVRFEFNPTTNLSENVMRVRLNKKSNELTDTIKQIILDLRKLQAGDISSTDIITRIQNSTGSVGVYISGWTVASRAIGSHFVFGNPNLDRLGSHTTPLNYLGSVIYQTYSIVASGMEVV